jgi:hypothetical protein
LTPLGEPAKLKIRDGRKAPVRRKETWLMSWNRVGTWTVLALSVLGMTVVGLLAADPPAAPKASAFAPAKDLQTQVRAYLGRIEDAVANAEAYDEKKESLVKDANTLIAIALALGLHDEDSEYKAAAPALMKAAGQLAQSKDLAAAKAATDAVKKAAESKDGDVSGLKWSKVAALPALMQQVPRINNPLKLNMKGTRFKSKAKQTMVDVAVLAVIAQAAMYDTSEVKKPGDEEKWFKFCADMRDAAVEVGKVVKAGKADSVERVMGKLMQSCDDCHEVFKPEQKGKE